MVAVGCDHNGRVWLGRFERHASAGQSAGHQREHDNNRRGVKRAREHFIPRRKSDHSCTADGAAAYKSATDRCGIDNSSDHEPADNNATTDDSAANQSAAHEPTADKSSAYESTPDGCRRRAGPTNDDKLLHNYDVDECAACDAGNEFGRIEQRMDLAPRRARGCRARGRRIPALAKASRARAGRDRVAQRTRKDIQRLEDHARPSRL
jgi:hypothetical protein